MSSMTNKATHSGAQTHLVLSEVSWYMCVCVWEAVGWKDNLVLVHTHCCVVFSSDLPVKDLR